MPHVGTAGDTASLEPAAEAPANVTFGGEVETFAVLLWASITASATFGHSA